MSYQAYKEQQANDMKWQSKYLQNVPLDTGITSPEGYNLYADQSAVNAYTAGMVANNVAPLYTNPAANLYAVGTQNQTLLATSSAQCQGCFNGVNKPDPRNHVVKPLYSASVFLAPAGTDLPNVHNVTGMY